MSKVIVEFKNVTKMFSLVNVSSGGLRSLIVNPFRAFNEFKKRKKFIALDNISFTVFEGETIGLVGTNGSGKSTILGLMAGVLRPTEGEVIINEKPFPMLELGAGFHPELNAIDNIFLNGALLGVPEKTINSRKDEIIKFAELEEFKNEPIRVFSSGMLARLGFSIVSILQPKFLIIDEVLAVGDGRFKKKCYKVIESFKKNKVTIIFVSHDAGEVRRLCDRVIWIDNHKIRESGKASLVLAKYEQFLKKGG